jgi:hypothetical protein
LAIELPDANGLAGHFETRSSRGRKEVQFFKIFSRVLPSFIFQGLKTSGELGCTSDRHQRSDAMNACPVLSYEPTEVLTLSPLPQLRRLMVTVSEVEVIITGEVSSFYMKQLAQEAVRPTLGERRLLNLVEVSGN